MQADFCSVFVLTMRHFFLGTHARAHRLHQERSGSAPAVVRPWWCVVESCLRATRHQRSTVRSIRSSKAAKSQLKSAAPHGCCAWARPKLACSTPACQSWCRHGTRRADVASHAPRQGASHRQDSKDVFRRGNAAHGAGLVQQTHQVAAARDLSLFVRCLFQPGPSRLRNRIESSN